MIAKTIQRRQNPRVCQIYNRPFLRRAFVDSHLAADKPSAPTVSAIPESELPGTHAESTPQIAGNSTPADETTELQAPPAGDWVETSEARRIVRAGEQAGDLSVADDGSAQYRGEMLFPAAHDPAATEVRLFLSPDSRRALVVQWDLDWGGLRAALLNLGAQRILKSDIIPESEVRGNADPNNVRQPMLPVAWSPNGDYAAFPLQAMEWQADLLLIDAESGNQAVLQTDDLQPGQWTFPKLETLHWDDDDWVSIEYDVGACADTDCTAPDVVGSISGGHRISALLANTMSAQETVPETKARPNEWGPGLVAGIDVGYYPCRAPADKTDACLRALGLSTDAIAFSHAVDGDYSGASVGASFTELGAVDLAVAEFIGNTVYRTPYLVNGEVGLNPVTFTADLVSTFSDDASRAMLQAFPHAAGGAGLEIRSHRVFNDGTQRFTVIETITDACRACPILGSAVSFIEIGPSTGERIVRRPIGLLLSDPASDEDLSADLLERRPQSLQVTLNGLGYDAGPMDGFPGPQTRQALLEFQAEFCLAQTGQPDATTVQNLLGASGVFTPCAGATLADEITASASTSAAEQPDEDVDRLQTAGLDNPNAGKDLPPQSTNTAEAPLGAPELTSGALRLGQETLASYDGDLAMIDQVADAAPYAIMSWAAYGDDDAMDMANAQGWRVGSDSADFALEDANLVTGDTVAILFERDGDDGATMRALAFRGSVLDGSWITNIAGTLTPSPLTTAQIAGAVRIARDVLAAHPDVVFTGHSLGGRLAQVVSVDTGRPAVVFNSAPLNLDETADAIVRTMLDLILERGGQDKVRRFRSPEDLLTAAAKDTVTIQTIPLLEDPHWTKNAIFPQWIGRALGEQSSFAHLARTVALGAEATRIARDEGWAAAASATSRFDVTLENAGIDNPTRMSNIGGAVDEPNAVRTIPSENGCELTSAIDASRFTWSGNCIGSMPAGNGTLTFYDGNLLVERLKVGDGTEFRLRDGKLHWVDDLGVTFEPGQTFNFSTGRFAAVFAKTSPDFNFHYRPTIDKVVHLAYNDFMQNRGFESEGARITGLAVQLTSSESEKHAFMIVDKQGIWNGRRWSYNNAARDTFENEKSSFNKQVESDQRESEKERAVAMIQDNFAAQRNALNISSDALMSGEPGGLDSLAAAMEIDNLRMLAQLEEGVQLIIPTSESFETIGTGNSRQYQVSYRVASPFASLEAAQRQRLMQVDFSWDKWMDQTSSVGQSKITLLTCQFSTLSEIPKSQTTVDAKLISFSSSRDSFQIVLECD